MSLSREEDVVVSEGRGAAKVGRQQTRKQGKARESVAPRGLQLPQNNEEAAFATEQPTSSADGIGTAEYERVQVKSK